MENQVIQALLTRRSVRKYQDKPLEAAVLETVLQAGTYAPTGRGMQSPVIVAVEDPADRAAVQALNCQARGFSGDPYYGAPAILLVFTDPQRNTGVEDASCVLATMMIAAHALGAASCWIHGEREMFELPEGKALLEKWGLPTGLRGVGALAVGYAEGPLPAPKERKADYIKRV